MNFDLLTDLKQAVQSCLEATCEYRHYISLGRPQAECNSIAFWYSNARRNNFDNDECSTQRLDSQIVVTLTRCCVTADGNPEFDFVQEEKDAECFHNDLAALIACLSCSLSSDSTLSCGIVIENVSYDNERFGGCYSADISLSLIEEICCLTEIP